jgi:hypothetical protein
MSRPPKPFSVLVTEKKSHRTKAELKQRQEGEAALSTGVALKERPQVRNNPTAHKEFKRLNGLLKTIGKNDAIYETIINRYCMLYAECFDLEAKRERIFESAKNLEEMLDEYRGGVSFDDFRSAARSISEMYQTMLACDKQIQAKRKMLFDIEKENIMTIAAAIRNIPKKNDKPKSRLAEALQGD